jgi:allantoicase
MYIHTHTHTHTCRYFDTCKHYFELQNEERYTHIRINYWPDGGVARLRVFGEVKKDWSATPSGGLVDLASTENGGLGLMASNAHYGAAFFSFFFCFSPCTRRPGIH